MIHVIGIDPGPIPGIVMLTPRGRRLDIDVVQCSSHTAPVILYSLLNECRAYQGEAPAVVQIEKFVVGRASQRSAGAGTVTRDLVGQLQQIAGDQPNVTVVMRSAAEVKPWATDERLDKAGLLDATKGMRHAKDAAKHCLYAAVKGGHLPDPLSKEWNYR